MRPIRTTDMAKIRLVGRDAGGVVRLLRELGGTEMPPSLRPDAAYRAGAMTRRMDRHDLQTVEWLLLHASGEHRIPFSQRRTARYWATHLEGRI
jgi:hypothetical protein